MGLFTRIKEKFSGPDYEGQKSETGYVEIEGPAGDERGKVVVRPFNLEDFEGIKPVLDTLREGRTIVLLNIRPLKDKDMSELKRAVNKLKKTVDAIEGEVAGFGDDFIVITPSFATIVRNAESSSVEE